MTSKARQPVPLRRCLVIGARDTCPFDVWNTAIGTPSSTKNLVLGGKRPGVLNSSLAGIPKADLWATEPGGLEQVGCVYTAQGFEFDYVGVIWGKDLTYDLDRQTWVGKREECADPVLLSRGMKGCSVHFLDKDTERFVRSRMESARTGDP